MTKSRAISLVQACEIAPGLLCLAKLAWHVSQRGKGIRSAPRTCSSRCAVEMNTISVSGVAKDFDGAAWAIALKLGDVSLKVAEIKEGLRLNCRAISLEFYFNQLQLVDLNETA